jgi:hypothetical protein
MVKITEGCIYLARKIRKSEIWTSKPSWWLKVWLHILQEVTHESKGKFRRGEGFFTRREIYKDCCIYREGIEENTLENVFKWLRKTEQIITRKSTRGIIIFVCKYDDYQNISNYKSSPKSYTENHTENPKEATEKPDDKQEVNNGNNILQPSADEVSSLKEKALSLSPISASTPSHKDLTQIVEHFKEVKGYKDEGLDKKFYQRNMKAAKELLEILKSVSECEACIDWQKKQRYEWTLETCVKKSADFKLKTEVY